MGSHEGQAKLFVGVAAFQQPTVIPECLASECLLRFARIRFETVHSEGDLPEAQRKASRTELAAQEPFFSSVGPLTAPVYATASTSRVGFSAIAEALPFSLGQRGHSVTSGGGLSNGQLATTDALVALVQQTVFPAFEHWCYAPDENFQRLRPLLHAEQPLLSRLLFSVPAQRRSKLAELRGRHRIATDDDASAAMHRGLTALERLLVHSGASVESSAGPSEVRFFHGTLQPTLVDCYAFAAASLALQSRFAPKSAAARFQAECGSKFPLLAHYAHTVALQFFEQYAGVHFLGIPPVVHHDDSPDPYLPGRRLVLAGTAAFAGFYFLVANAPLLLAVLTAVDGEEYEAPVLPEDLDDDE